jgi:hypothetical protein
MRNPMSWLAWLDAAVFLSLEKYAPLCAEGLYIRLSQQERETIRDLLLSKSVDEVETLMDGPQIEVALSFHGIERSKRIVARTAWLFQEYHHTPHFAWDIYMRALKEPFFLRYVPAAYDPENVWNRYSTLLARFNQTALELEQSPSFGVDAAVLTACHKIQSELDALEPEEVPPSDPWIPGDIRLSVRRSQAEKMLRWLSHIIPPPSQEELATDLDPRSRPSPFPAGLTFPTLNELNPTLNELKSPDLSGPITE